MERKSFRLLLVLLFLLVLALSMFIEPTYDDWAFLKYFTHPENWRIASYHWLYDSILLPRNFWRPWEDMLLMGETKLPFLYPYLNHFIIVSLHFGAGWILAKILRQFEFKKNVVFGSILFYLIATTSMGGMLSVDSITQVLATFFGILSVYFYLSTIRHKYILWLITGFIACWSKESGFVFFVAAPLMRLLLGIRRENLLHIKQIPFGKLSRLILIASVPMFIYLAIYFIGIRTQQDYVASQKSSHSIVQVDKHVQPNPSSKITLDEIARSQTGYKATPMILVKNVFILYVAGLFPVDTSSIYYKNWLLLSLSFVLSLSAVLLLLRIIRKNIRWLQVLVCVLLIFVVSVPSLITRSGEISPHQVNLFIALLLAVLFESYRLRKLDYLLLASFFLSTLMSDIHKYSLAYEGGMAGKMMGREVKQKSVPNPEKVLWIGATENVLIRAGAAFNNSPYYAFGRGAAAIREYNYSYPKHLDWIELPLARFNKQVIDSIVVANRNTYNCIWVTYGDNVQVINGFNL